MKAFIARSLCASRDFQTPWVLGEFLPCEGAVMGKVEVFFFIKRLCAISPQARDSLRLRLPVVTQGLTISRGHILHFPPKTKHNKL